MCPNEMNNAVSIQLIGDKEELTGVQEGSYVRLPGTIAERFPSIKKAIEEQEVIEKEGGILNNIWGILETETGEQLAKGQKLYARVRIQLKSGRFVIAAATVALGVVAVITVPKIKSHKKR